MDSDYKDTVASDPSYCQPWYDCRTCPMLNCVYSIRRHDDE